MEAPPLCSINPSCSPFHVPTCPLHMHDKHSFVALAFSSKIIQRQKSIPYGVTLCNTAPFPALFPISEGKRAGSEVVCNRENKKTALAQYFSAGMRNLCMLFCSVFATLSTKLNLFAFVSVPSVFLRPFKL